MLFASIDHNKNGYIPSRDTRWKLIWYEMVNINSFFSFFLFFLTLNQDSYFPFQPFLLTTTTYKTPPPSILPLIPLSISSPTVKPLLWTPPPSQKPSLPSNSLLSPPWSLTDNHFYGVYATKGKSLLHNSPSKLWFNHDKPTFLLLFWTLEEQMVGFWRR